MPWDYFLTIGVRLFYCYQIKLWNYYKQKHPKLKLLIQKLYCRAKKPIHSAVFDDTNEQVNWKAAIKKGGCGQSGLDADNSRRVLTSRSLGFSSVDLRKYFANFFKIICIKYIHISEAGPDNSLETFIASLSIPLGVGEALLRIIGKVVM